MNPGALRKSYYSPERNRQLHVQEHYIKVSGLVVHLLSDFDPGLRPRHINEGLSAVEKLRLAQG